MPTVVRSTTRIALNGVGVRYRHDRRFTIDRPRGTGDYVFLHFLTPVTMRLNGHPVAIPPESCLLYGPTTPQWFSGIHWAMDVNWFHFGCRSRFLADLGIPLDQPISGRHFPFVEPLLRDMQRERQRAEPRWEDAVHALATLCLLRVARTRYAEEEPGLTARMHGRLEAIRDLRSRILERPNQRWTLHGMARMAGLSPSRFSALYRRFFSRSPIDDVIAARIDKARLLLTNTRLAVGDVARDCGFQSISHFSRQFRRWVGCAPRDYYRRFIADTLERRPQD
jgi:AraC family transcriptional regulator of arabinose operon